MVDIVDCPICKENILDADRFVTNCKHLYHKNCIEMSLRNSKNCPLCRADLGIHLCAECDKFILGGDQKKLSIIKEQIYYVHPLCTNTCATKYLMMKRHVQVIINMFNSIHVFLMFAHQNPIDDFCVIESIRRLLFSGETVCQKIAESMHFVAEAVTASF